jgi:hypothetical protein
MAKLLVTYTQGKNQLQIFEDKDAADGHNYIAEFDGERSISATEFRTAVRQSFQKHKFNPFAVTPPYSEDHPHQNLSNAELFEREFRAHPRLEGWTPLHPGLFVRKDAQIEIVSIETWGHDGMFNRNQYKAVTYSIIEPDSADRVGSAVYKQNSTHAINTKVLGQKFRALLNTGTKLNTEISEPPFSFGGDIKSPEEIPPRWREAYWRLSKCQNLLELPLNLRRSRALLEEAYELGLSVREAELAEAHEADAKRGARVSLGGAEGGNKSGAKSSKHAARWKMNLAKWLQPIIAACVANKQGGISREDIAAIAEKQWPKDGFAGTPGLHKQISPPTRVTLVKILKDLEQQGQIKRPSSPRGRKKQSE